MEIQIYLDFRFLFLTLVLHKRKKIKKKGEEASHWADSPAASPHFGPPARPLGPAQPARQAAAQSAPRAPFSPTLSDRWALTVRSSSNLRLNASLVVSLSMALKPWSPSPILLSLTLGRPCLPCTVDPRRRGQGPPASAPPRPKLRMD